MFRKSVPALFIWLLAFWMAACVVSRNPVSGRKRLYAYSWKEEIRIGKQADAEIIAQYGVYEDPELAAYVTEVGERVLAQSHLRRPDTPAEYRNTPFTFRVLDSPVVNAFALPGGFIYVTRGLLAHLQNEAQLAVVLGHEIGHVAARHTSQRMLEINLGQVGLLGGAILGQEILGLPAQDILQIGSTMAQLLFLKYSRDDEREADRLGVEYAALSGYEVAEAAAFFRTLERLSEQHGAELPSFLSTHPDPGERAQTIRQLAATWEARQPLTIVRQEAYLTRLEGLVYGENPRQGFVRNGFFYHPELRFFFPLPVDWQVINEAQRVVLVEPEQQAFMELRIVGGRGELDAAARAFQPEGFVPIRREAVRVGAFPAYVVEGQLRDDRGVYHLLAYFIEYEGRVYRFLGVTSESLFAATAPVFRMTMTRFSALQDPDILNVQPYRLVVVQAPRTAPFEELIPDDTPAEISAEELAILNQVERRQVIPAGTWLKWVR